MKIYELSILMGATILLKLFLRSPENEYPGMYSGMKVGPIIEAEFNKMRIQKEPDFRI